MVRCCKIPHSQTLPHSAMLQNATLNINEHLVMQIATSWCEAHSWHTSCMALHTSCQLGVALCNNGAASCNTGRCILQRDAGSVPEIRSALHHWRCSMQHGKQEACQFDVALCIKHVAQRNADVASCIIYVEWLILDVALCNAEPRALDVARRASHTDPRP